MERTESVVVQVAPQYENEKISEMQMFGWNLQGRQEVHQEGDAYGRPSYLNSDNYVVKTKVSSYVKLHFIRSLNLRNLNEIQQIESEYHNLAIPAPKSYVVPGCLIAFFAFAIFGVTPVLMKKSVSDGLFGLAVYVTFAALGVLWLVSRIRKNQEAKTIRQQSLQRIEELKARLRMLY